VKYRPHKRLLADAMAEVIELPDRAALVKHLANDLAHWGTTVGDDDVKVAPYGHDDRIGWDTHIVTIRNKQLPGGNWYFGEAMGPDYFGAIGFTDSPA
jgi:hypothetical protein